MRYLVTLLLAALSLNAVGQIEWDFPYNPDADNDAYVSSTDLLELLSLYGQEFSSDELYLSQDSTSLIVYVGELIRQECMISCYNLSGNWKVIDWEGISAHYSELILDNGSWTNENADTWPYMWILPESISNQMYPFDLVLRNRNIKYYYDNNVAQGSIGAFSDGYQPNSNHGWEYDCWCITRERPNVEYKMFTYLSNDSETEEMVNSLAQEGWRLMPAMNGSEEKVTMWRWVE